MLTLQDITKIIRDQPLPEIKLAREESSTYIRHVFGIGTIEYLKRLDEWENENQAKARQDHAIPNPWIVSELIRPVDNIWQAKGGSLSFRFSGTDMTDDFNDKLKNVRKGLSMRQFMKDVWFQRFLADPNGLIFLEVDRDGTKAELTYKSIHKIRAYDTDGIDVKWVVFESDVTLFEGEKKDIKVELSWAVDEMFYYHVRNDGKEVTITEVIENNFGFVPTIVNSSIYNTEKKIKESIIAKQVDLLNSYLTKNSVKEIYYYKHGYPLFWMYQSLCPTCNGNRKVGTDVCPTCKGSGYSAKKDVTDVYLYPKPSEPGIDQAIPPAGYVQTAVETIEENRNELDWLFDKMFHSLWGTTTEKMNNETATGRFIDVQAVYNKLNEIADIIQTIEQKLTYIFGKFYYLLTLQDVDLSYGRRYIAENPDVLWERYEQARSNGSPVATLSYMLEQFYYSEFSTNPSMAEYYIKMIYVEPDVHGIGNISPDMEEAKPYFSDWFATIEPVETENLTVEELKKQFLDYVSKQPSRKTTIGFNNNKLDKNDKIINQGA